MTHVLRRISADLHIHTALSPCGSEEMTPPAIVAAALEAGLDMIAICDHNTAGNAAAVQEAAAAQAAAGGPPLVVLAGMEVASAEEAHVVGLFPDAAAAERAAAEVRAVLPQADDQLLLLLRSPRYPRLQGRPHRLGERRPWPSPPPST